jgi:CBS domain-containing protein
MTEKPGLETLTVADIMTRDVVTVAPDYTVAELVQLLEFEQISGAPVVDENAAVLGVVSATDVLRLAAHEAEITAGDTTIEASDNTPYPYFVNPDDLPQLRARSPAVATSAFSEYTVRDIMTPATFSVHASATLPELARFLWRGQIHRALVVEGEKLRGLVTSFDVVRAVAGELER